VAISRSALWVIGLIIGCRQGINSPPPIENLMRALSIAEREIAQNDLDHNGQRDYWRKDVAGLLQFSPKLPPEIASADVTNSDVAGKSKSPVPIQGYLVASIRFPKEKDLSERKCFAICAYPVQYQEATRFVYLTVHRIDSEVEFQGDPKLGASKIYRKINIATYRKDLGPAGAAGLTHVPEGLDGYQEVEGWSKVAAETPP
jgi:hypothetical protein